MRNVRASFTVFQCIAELCAQFQNKEHVAPLRDNVGVQIKWWIQAVKKFI
jgi:hypothetical protein